MHLGVNDLPFQSQKKKKKKENKKERKKKEIIKQSESYSSQLAYA